MSIRRDYKPASTWQRRRQSVRRHGLLVVALVLIGFGGGLLAYFKGHQANQVEQTATAAATPPSSASTTPAPAISNHAAAARARPALPEAIPAPLKPKYDFYTELPKRQIRFQRDIPDPDAMLRLPFDWPQPTIEAPRRQVPSEKNRIAPLMIQAAANHTILSNT